MIPLATQPPQSPPRPPICCPHTRRGTGAQGQQDHPRKSYLGAAPAPAFLLPSPPSSAGLYPVAVSETWGKKHNAVQVPSLIPPDSEGRGHPCPGGCPTAEPSKLPSSPLSGDHLPPTAMRSEQQAPGVPRPRSQWGRLCPQSTSDSVWRHSGLSQRGGCSWHLGQRPGCRSTRCAAQNGPRPRQSPALCADGAAASRGCCRTALCLGDGCGSGRCVVRVFCDVLFVTWPQQKREECSDPGSAMGPQTLSNSHSCDRSFG